MHWPCTTTSTTLWAAAQRVALAKCLLSNHLAVARLEGKMRPKGGGCNEQWPMSNGGVNSKLGALSECKLCNFCPLAGSSSSFRRPEPKSRHRLYMDRREREQQQQQQQQRHSQPQRRDSSSSLCSRKRQSVSSAQKAMGLQVASCSLGNWQVSFSVVHSLAHIGIARPPRIKNTH